MKAVEQALINAQYLFIIISLKGKSQRDFLWFIGDAHEYRPHPVKGQQPVKLGAKKRFDLSWFPKVTNYLEPVYLGM